MFCKQCGQELSEDSLFCNKCGDKIVLEIPFVEKCKLNNLIENTQQHEAEIKKKQKKKRIFAVILMLVAILFGTISYFAINTVEYKETAYVYYYNASLAEGYLDMAEEFSSEKYLVEAFLHQAEQAQETADMYAAYVGTHKFINIIFGLMSVVLLITSLVCLVLGFKKPKTQAIQSSLM